MVVSAVAAATHPRHRFCSADGGLEDVHLLRRALHTSRSGSKTGPQKLGLTEPAIRGLGLLQKVPLIPLQVTHWFREFRV